MQAKGLSNDNRDLTSAASVLRWPHGSARALALLLGTALGATFMAPMAAAVAQSAAVSASRVDFNIPAQPLSSALVQFSNQTGLELFANADLVRGRNSPGVMGELAYADALARLLSGTGLAYRLDGNSVSIADPSAGTASIADADGSIVLETIDVNAWVESATGPVEGLVAHQSATGTKTDAALVDVPAAVSVISTAELARRGAQTLDSALDYTSGVNSNHYGADKRYDFVAIRGFTETSTGIYRDGLPGRLSGAFTNSRVEPYGMERIEVLKGGTSTLYGLNAPGGLVNMVTKRPLGYEHGEVYTTVGNGHLETGTDFGGPMSADGTWNYRITGKWQDGQDGHEWANDDRLYIAPAISWKPSEMTTLTLLADYNKREGANRHGIPLGYDIDPETYLGEKQFDQNDTTEWNFGWVFDHDFGNGLKFHQNARYNDLTLTNKNTYLMSYQGYGAIDRVAMQVDGERDRFSIDNNIQYETSFDRIDSTTLLGFDYSQSTVAERDYRGIIPGIGSDITNPIHCTPNCTITDSPLLWPTPYTIEGEEKTLGVYGQEELTLDDRWILTLGARYDRVQGNASGNFVFIPGLYELSDSVEIDEAAWTKRAGLTYKATEEVSLYGSYAESFMPVAPSPTPFGGGTTTRLLVHEPVTGTTWEAGVKYQPVGMNALFSAAIFDITENNVPRSLIDGTVEQIGEVRTRGLELEAKAALTEDLNLLFSYTYLDSEITKGRTPQEEGTRMPFIPEYMASAWIDYTIRGQGQMGDLTLGVGARVVGPRYAEESAPGTTQMDPYMVVDAAVHYQVSENASLSLTATNLFDTEYVSYVETYSEPDTLMYGDRRSVKATLKWTW